MFQSNEELPVIIATIGYDNVGDIPFYLDTSACSHIKVRIDLPLCECPDFLISEILEYEPTVCENPNNSIFNDEYIALFNLDEEQDTKTYHYEFESLENGVERLLISFNEYSPPILTYLNTNLSSNEVRENNLKVYPNPVKDRLFFSKPFESVEIYNLTGAKLLSATSQDYLDISFLLKGIYLVKVLSENDTPEVFKIIKE